MNCVYCNKFVVIYGQNCEQCKVDVCNDCSKRICNNCNFKKVPIRYWVIGHEKNKAKGGFEDVIYNTNDITDARRFKKYDDKMEVYIYDILLEDYVD